MKKKLTIILILTVSVSIYFVSSMPRTLTSVAELPNKNIGVIGLDLQIYVIDSCEYIGRESGLYGHYISVLTHKGNCKYCAARLKKLSN